MVTPISLYSFVLLMLLYRKASALNNRHVCLIDSYSSIRGPHFAALFDQMVEQTGRVDKQVALCTIQRDVEHVQDFLQPTLVEDLELDSCDLVVLDDYNPLSFNEKMNQINPSILWVTGSNGFEMRYRMRTSGLDTFIEGSAGPLEGSLATLYVGEGAGAVCGGSTMAIAHVRGDDTKATPEPQFRGVGLLGSGRSVSFGLDEKVLRAHPKTKDIIDTITALENDQVFIWSQSRDQVMSCSMTASRKGTIENWHSPPPLQPMVEDDFGGVKCDGEPAVDPSRVMQSVGDSEWLDEYSG